MIKEFSYGIIPLRKQNDRWEVFLVQHRQGHWAMPKGHQEKGEKPLETAERELLEETSLRIQTLLSETAFVEKYRFRHEGREIEKEVGYFPAIVEGDISLQMVELQNGGWFSLEDAYHKITFSEARRIFTECRKLLVAP